MMTDHIMADPEPENTNPNQLTEAEQELENQRESVLQAIDKLIDRSSEYEEHFRELLRADSTHDDQPAEFMSNDRDEFMSDQLAESTLTSDHRAEPMSDQPAESTSTSTSDHELAWPMCDSSHLNDHSNRLQTSLLPSLRDQLTCIARLLDPFTLLQDPHQQLKSISENLSKLEESLDEIQSSFRRSFQTFRKNGGDYPELTLVKYLYVITKLSRVKARISCHLLPSYYEFMEKINLTTRPNNETIQTELVTEHLRVHTNTTESVQLIDQLNEWIGLSEFGVLYGSWREVMTWICMPYLSLNSKHTTVIKRTPNTKRFHQMVTLSVPILKLARLFFKKLSDTATRRGDFGIDLELNPTQIQQLMSDSLMVYSDLNRISNIFKLVPDQDEETELQELSLEMQNLSQHMKSLFSHLHSYVLIYPLKNHFKTWCHTWDNEITWAIQNFNQIADEQALLTLVRNQLREG